MTDTSQQSTGEREASASSDDRSAPTPTGLLSGLRIVSLLTLLSRILGMARDIGMAAIFARGVEMDAFSVAFRVPNLARRLFGEGALTSAFLPVFVRELQHSGRESAWRLASAVLLLLAMILSAFVVLCELLLWGISAIWEIAPETELLIGLTAVTLPYLILICLVAQVSAVLHALGHFTWPALMPVLLNVIWIATLWLVTPAFTSTHGKIYTVAGCIIVAGFVQLSAQLPTLRRLGFRFDSQWRDARDSVAEIGRAMLPVIVGLSITQLNTLLDSLIAWSFARPPSGSLQMSWLPGAPDYPLEQGTASALYFGQRMYQFPLGVFGVALGTVLFPLLSRHAEQGRIDRLRSDFSLGMRLVIALGLPASLGLMLLAEPAAVLLFQHGQFTAEDTRQTVGMIAAYGSAVWAYCGLTVLHRGYYAVGDRLTPLRIGLPAIVFNLALNLVLIWFLGGRGLAIGTALTAMLQFSVAAWFVQHRIGRLDWVSFRLTAFKTVIATLLMGCVCVLLIAQLPPGGSLGRRLVAVCLPLAASVLVYFAAARVLRMDEPWLLFKRDLADHVEDE